MLAGLLTTWTTARQASLVVEEYSGVTAVDITLAGLENQNDTDRKPWLSLMESVEGIMKGMVEGTGGD